MKREILFRAWNGAEGKIQGKQRTPNSYSLDYGFSVDTPELIFMQFVGVQIDGTPVYEGDIL